MTFVFLCFDIYSMPIAKHIADEGHDVLVGVIEDRKDMRLEEANSTEKPEAKKQRLSNHKGLLKKEPFAKVMDKLKAVPKDEQDEYFFFFDFNDMYRISQDILAMGFKKGLFPLEYDYKMERERTVAKKFVEKHYPDLKLAEAKTFKTIEEGLAHVEESADTVFVLKSNGNLGKTIVPHTNDAKIAKKLISDALKKYAKEYQAQGYTLEKKILNAFEVTPIMAFWNGDPVYSLVEFENKEFGSGNIGPLKGGNQALCVRTQFKCRINEIAFPPVVYDIAKRRSGMYIADAGLLYDGKDFYFTEYCAQRFGWDGIFSEMVMRDDGEPFVAAYFEDVMAGKSPLRRKYGAYVRLFNYEGGYEDSGVPKDDIPVTWYSSIEKNLFLYNVKMKGDDCVSVGGCDFLGVMTGSSDTLESAVNKMYRGLDKFHFERLYLRPSFDFMSRDYPTSILNRLDAVREWL